MLAPLYLDIWPWLCWHSFTWLGSLSVSGCAGTPLIGWAGYLYVVMLATSIWLGWLSVPGCAGTPLSGYQYLVVLATLFLAGLAICTWLCWHPSTWLGWLSVPGCSGTPLPGWDGYLYLADTPLPGYLYLAALAPLYLAICTWLH